MNDDVIKVDLNNPPVKKEETTPEVVAEALAPVEPVEVKKEPKLNADGDILIDLNEETDAVQQVQGESEESVLRDERVEETETAKEESSPLEVVNEEETPKVDEPKSNNPLSQAVTENQRNLPEGFEKVLDFLEDTGGTLEDYVNLNRDLSALDDNTLIKEFLKSSKPHLDDDDIQFIMTEKYTEKKDDDGYGSESDSRAMKLARKEVLFEANNHFKGVQDKYYADLKLRKQAGSSPEITKAIEFYQDYQKGVETSKQFNEDFKAKNSNLFNNDFKGFDFNVGESKYRYKADPVKTGEVQSDANNVFSKFYDNKSGLLNDPQGYHKALFAANNADKLAQHFYEQGKAEALKQSAMESKNINMSARADNSAVTTPSGSKVRIVSGDDKHTFGNKLRVKGWN